MGCPSEVEIGDNLVFSVTTHDPDTGVLTDADAVPTYRVYEDETGTAILTGSMAKLDDANTTGFYSEALACTSGNGFENGKTYTVYIEATVDSDKGGISFGFKAYDRRKSNLTAVDGTAQRATDLAEIAQYLIASAATLTDIVADNSILAKLLATSGDISEFNEATDSLQSIRDVAPHGTAMRGTDNAALAATALSNATWTDARAGYLDKLNVTGTLAHSDAAATYKADVSAVALEATLTTMKGAGFSSATDSLEALRDRGDAAWITATSVTVSDKTGFSLAADQSGVTVGTVNALGTAAQGHVNAEVVDVIGTDTIAEVAQGIPAKNPTLAAAVMTMYMCIRNKLTVTSTEKAWYNDAGTKVAKKTLSDDGTTYTETEAVSGA